ncbi:MAG TPA: T9SS type A sorting domain-containing protein [Arachidicoccus sp.]|nr:T9SS type A sorting domain-containing protein [Arachidicoccus sp.]
MKKLILAMMFVSSFSHLIAQKTYYVKPVATGNGLGRTWNGASGNLQNMINNADSGDMIFVAKGVYKRPNKGQYFSMKRGVKIYGGFKVGTTRLADRNLASGDTSILVGNGNSVIRNNNNRLDSSSVLDGFKITGGDATNGDGDNLDHGGGIYNYKVSPHLTNLWVVQNLAYYGQGICNIQSTPVISQVNIHNTEQYECDSGAGMYNIRSSAILTNMVISGNIAAFGGGMCNVNSNPKLTNVVFSGNQSYYGGAMYNTFSSPILTNVTITRNFAPESSTDAFRARGGAMYNINNSSPVLRNCIVYYNLRFEWGLRPSVINDENSVPSYAYCLVEGLSGTDNGNIDGTTNDARFVDNTWPFGSTFTVGDYHLLEDSPAIDKGDPAIPPLLNLPVIDLDGHPRIVNNRVDMGAYEYQAAALPVSILGFKGTYKEGIAILEWQSGVETGLRHYQLEKSMDGNKFVEVATIIATGSNSSYVYPISNTASASWYRLKLIDLDGKSRYHNKIVSIMQGKATENMLVYPNPATQFINVRVAAEGSISIYNITGRLVNKFKLTAGLNKINIQSLSSGVYFGKVNGQTVKFLKK